MAHTIELFLDKRIASISVPVLCGRIRAPQVFGEISSEQTRCHVQHCYVILISNILKAILQVLIYKALYDKPYLESKTTMTTGEWSCLISFTWAPLTCSERGGSEKFKMKIYVSSGIRTHTAPVHDRKVSALDRSATLVRYQVEHYSLTVF